MRFVRCGIPLVIAGAGACLAAVGGGVATGSDVVFAVAPVASPVMVIDALAALLAGLMTGLVMVRGGLCFNRAVRRGAFEHRPALLRAFLFAVAAQLVILPALVALGVGPLERSTRAGGTAFLPVAELAGGLCFGVGMALAGGCVTGMLWKAGAGAMALAVAIAGFAAGELLIRGPGAGVIAALDDTAQIDERALPQLLGVGYATPALVLGALGFALLLARGHRGVLAGLALGAAGALTWIAADLAGYGYGLGFVGAAEGTRVALGAGAALPFQLYLAVGVVLGAALAGPRRLLLPDGARAARALAGGLLMGAGGSIAHGCNIGHGVTGLPLLSFGSLLAVSAMAAGAALTWRFALAGRPALLGREQPSAM
jgi:uncharacterized protein